MKARIVFLPGDGIGPEVCAEARRVLDGIGDVSGHEFEVVEGEIGVTAILNTGDPLPEDTRKLCLTGDAVMLGAVGGPTGTGYNGRRPEAGLLDLRKLLGNYANLRPVAASAALAHQSPLRPERVAGVDLLVVRELLGGIYFGKPSDTIDGVARDTEVYSEAEVRRISETAFQTARQRRSKVTSVDKANVLESSRLWRRVATEVAGKYPDVTFENMLVDNCAMQLVSNPAQFDVILTSNMFGDILSDEASVLTGSLGMLPSGSVGGKIGLYEPVHGSAPDIAGTGKANPIGAILSIAMMLELGFGLAEEGAAVRRGVDAVLTAGYRTPDLASGAEQEKAATTEMVGTMVTDALRKKAHA
jgi:3-isopropylmalate dehydrogenase